MPGSEFMPYPDAGTLQQPSGECAQGLVNVGLLAPTGEVVTPGTIGKEGASLVV
ncbi:hypothetical protein IWX87_002144 [Polaromonas sp. CG_9.7]|nr:hypothetical protein [Polaromonas sp. CG_9.7]MBG6114186.1 hypothetical protein [Polaromonas sp. CG_9.2]MDH6182857.1 hypothetical protein [Polaromonas sp. CG_23.6]